MTLSLAPKHLVIDGFLSDDILAALDEYARVDAVMQLADLGAAPGEAYSAMRKLWLRDGALGPLEPAFRAATMNRFESLCRGSGIAPFEVSRVETEVVAQRPGSFFAKHVDTDTREAAQFQTTVRMISIVFYFPYEPLAFSGGELVFYDFTGRIETARIEPRRNRLIAFPSFAYHEVTPVTAGDDTIDGARWSVNCWLHRDRHVGA